MSNFAKSGGDIMTKEMVHLVFPQKLIKEPVIYTMAKKYDENRHVPYDIQPASSKMWPNQNTGAAETKQAALSKVQEIGVFLSSTETKTIPNDRRKESAREDKIKVRLTFPPSHRRSETGMLFLILLIPKSRERTFPSQLKY